MSLYFDNEKLFDAEGHLTDDGLYALKDGTLDDLGALEAAEHLSFCDYCLLRYTELIDAAPACLQEPMRDLIPQVQNLMRMRSIRVFTNKYISIAAAVILAFSLWNFGVFDFDPGNAQQKAERLSEGPRFSVSQSIQQVIGGIGKTIDQVLEELQACVQSGFAQLKDQHPDTNQQSGGTQPAKGE